MTISVCIICFNEEHNIRRCLDSSTWADEIVVVDSVSQDKTVAIAREYTDKVYQQAWPGYMEQKNFALSKAHGDWVLSLDADEEVSPELREEILTEIRRHHTNDGYRIPRRSFYQGRWIDHSGFYPDRQLRLFRSECGRWTGGRVHEKVEIKGSVGDLKHDLLHYPYKGTISGQLQTVNSFSSLLAQDMYAKGKQYHLWLLVARPAFKFLEVYVLKLGFLDGLAGFIIAITSAYALFVRYVKLREIENRFGNQPAK
ncbi:MAG: glycosyltransferase family 2 protein [Deltaproteobacteria bacterium]|nr:glycosyltransferase family 2 protein [Deltaproteobacteria bacterium]MBW2338969.1 glycosyltransferase family 2 protein [Deltaproteobacteria bacterium]